MHTDGKAPGAFLSFAIFIWFMFNEQRNELKNEICLLGLKSMNFIFHCVCVCDMFGVCVCVSVCDWNLYMRQRTHFNAESTTTTTSLHEPINLNYNSMCNIMYVYREPRNAPVIYTSIYYYDPFHRIFHWCEMRTQLVYGELLFTRHTAHIIKY